LQLETEKNFAPSVFSARLGCSDRSEVDGSTRTA
jgi:hypothetical protein